jgi:small-conductance mechanosensitive channel
MKFRASLFILVSAALAFFLPGPLSAQDAPASGGDVPAALADNAADLQSQTSVVASDTFSAAAGTVQGVVADPAAPSIPSAPNPIEEIEELEQDVTGGTAFGEFAKKFGIALAIIAGQVLLIWLVWQLFKIFAKKATDYSREKIKPLAIKKLRLLSTKQITNLILFALRILKYVITAFQLFLTVPLVFSLFPATRHIAEALFGYIFTPLRNIAVGTIRYIPNLFTIAIILVITRYVIRALKFFAIQIEREKLVISGFYPDWATPTFNILRVLLYAFTVAVIYPYLPGSDSKIFQGISVFVGIIFSLGSSTVIGNLMAGLVITYMRPFKIGDRIQIKEVTGFVVEKTLMVIRIKTHKNEYVTFPNMMILSSNIVNYHTSVIEDEEGLILHADVTMGYAVPWQQVHGILIAAALETSHVLKSPKPFVLQTALDDFYANYQINLYTKEVEKVPRIYSELYEHLQDAFKAANIDLTAPTYQIRLPPDAGKGAVTDTGASGASAGTAGAATGSTGDAAEKKPARTRKKAVKS